MASEKGSRAASDGMQRHQSGQSAEAAGNELSLRAVEPVNIRVRQLSAAIDVYPGPIQEMLVMVPGNKAKASVTRKPILRDVSADFPAGSLTAIIGGSGSGKTSLLNIMAQRMRSRRLHVSGTTSYDVPTIRHAYCMQQDVLIPTLTVRETIQYAADLRLGDSTKEERHRIVEEVILELGLKECADTRIGSRSGASGGERRRTSIGVQLLANPSVLFLDEPTTGLDATSAFQLVRTMKNLARKGRNIIMTIHQPRSEIWSLCDRMIVLTGGSCVYSGPTADCVPYFETLGFPLPPFVNPAEHVIDIAAIDNRSPEAEEASTARVEEVKAAWSARTASAGTEKSEKQDSGPLQSYSSGSFVGFGTGLLRQTQVLTARTFKVTYRDPMGMAGSILEAIVMAIVTGWIFYDLDGSLSGIRSREGALYVASSLQGYLILLYETYRLTIDIELFDRERGEGVVGIPAFLISRRLARFLIEDIPVPFLYSVIFYFMVGFRADASQFFIFFAVLLLSQYIAVCLATVCVAVSRNFAGASLIANLGYTIQSLSCGFFVQLSTIPVYMRWLKWVAYVFYGFGALSTNEFAGRLYDCPYQGGKGDPACKEYTGEYVLESLSLPKNWLVVPICALVAYAIAFYIGAGLILRFWEVEIRISRARVSETDSAAGKEQMTARSHHESLRTVEISLSRFALHVEGRRKPWKSAEKTTILNPITARFPPGELCVVMGPSGSGKTSLLHAMATRLDNSTSSRYHASGLLMFNGAVPSESVIKSVCSFVTQQEDEAALSALTVRETIHFAAALRLPPFFSDAEKKKRAESVLLKLGLKDCADTAIGDDRLGIKGISGGERRRVSIAVQILTDPRILFLDEPTSGLDAFTASSIIEVLKGLADEGRTIVLTIHQARSDLFKHFGSVLLLARGGFPVYTGQASGMLAHFDSLGYKCPRTTNPADFALDLISVDLQEAKREVASREKVRSLIESWGDEQSSATPPRMGKLSTPAELGGLEKSMAPLRVAYPVLMRRGIINFRRQPPVVVGRIMQVLGYGIVLALYFAPLKHDYYSVQSRVGFIQEIAALYFVGMLQNVAVYPTEKVVAYREFADQAYSVEAFFLQYTSLEVPFEIVTSLLFALLSDLAVGLPRTAKMFFVVAYNCFCIVSCGESLGIIFNTFFNHTGFAVNVTSVILSLATIMAGVLSIGIPSFLQAFNYLSPLKYAIANLAVYSLRGQNFTCTAAQRLSNGRCPIETGEQVLQLYQLESNSGLNLAALGIATVVYRLLAYLLLKAMKTRWTWSRWRGRGDGAAMSGMEGDHATAVEDGR